MALLGACDRGARAPVIGIAAALPRPGVVEVAEDALREQGIDSSRVRIHELAVGTGLAGEIQTAVALTRDPRLAVVVGHAGSRGSLLAAPIYSEAHVPMIVPLGTSRRLREAGPWVFPIAPDDSAEGAFIAAYVTDSLHAHAVSIAYTSDEYGVGLKTAIGAALPRHGAHVVDALSIAPADCRASGNEPFDLAVSASLQQGRPDAVVIAAGTTPSACTAHEFRTLLRSEVPVVMADGAEPGDTFASRAGQTDSMYFVAFWYPAAAPARSASFVARFRRITGRAPAPADAVWFDAVMLAARAVVAAGSDGELVRAYLASVGGATPAYDGVTGTISFPPPSRIPLLMLAVRGTRTEIVARR